MGALDLGFDTSLIGSWLASILCGLAYAQAFAYFSNFPNDSWIRKALVIASILFSLVGLVGAYADVYFPCVTFWGNPSALLTETWAVPMYSVANTMQALTVDSYLISRFYSVSKNIFVSLLLALITLFAFVMALLAVFLFPGIENFDKVKPIVYIWVIAAVVADVAIATCLVWTLQAMKTNFKDTNRLIRHVSIISIQNGLATSVCAIAGMIATIFKIQSNVPAVFFFLLSPLYLITLLSNFNLRGNGKSGSRTWSSSRNNNTNVPNTSIVINGIHVQRSAIVTVDATTSEIEMGTSKKQDDGGDYSTSEAFRGQPFAPN
ncbi:hypothetical protein B0H14DRAFT_3878277 [Mycena olivaceomarginata]|nr:hypothetical protein B0H14DRAFT_3878277 [Mycena olivaceomarginata]